MHEADRLKFYKAASPTKKEFIGDTTVLARDIPKLFTAEFWQAAGIWNSFKMFGLPFDGGWAQQPAHLIRIIIIGEQEHNKWQEAQLDANKRKFKAANKGRSQSRRPRTK